MWNFWKWIIRADLSEIPDKKMLVFLWIHEMSHQFSYRLLAENIPFFENKLKIYIKSN